MGVVGDVRHLGLDQAAAPHAYFPLAQVPRRAMHVVVRTAGEPLALVALVRREVRALDPRLPAPELRPLAHVVSESTSRSRFLATLLGIFATVALALAALGIFGLLSYTVVQRTREIGIRVALGARAGEVLGMVLRRALRLATVGAVVGLVGVVVLTRFAGALLHGVSPTDPLTLVLVVVLLVGTVLVASLVPARRAAAVQPTVALRHE